jgi:hypothetical protein
MTRKNLEGFPTSWGSSRVSVFVHTGPASYVAAGSDDTYPNLGDRVTVEEAGLKAFDAVIPVGVSSISGAYRVEVLYPGGNTPTTGGAAVPDRFVILRWIVVATNAEVEVETDLSGQSVRLLAIGPK